MLQHALAATLCLMKFAANVLQAELDALSAERDELAARVEAQQQEVEQVRCDMRR